MKKIVIIRGKATAGKSTVSHALASVLPGWIFIDPWKIKEMFEPLDLKDRTPLKNASKKAMITIMREVMKSLQINILVQETSRSFLNKHLKNEIKKYNYNIYSFFLDVSLKEAIKRDIKRKKPTMNIGKGVKGEQEWKKIKAQPEKGDIVIDTSRCNVKQVVSSILKTIKEKPKKHPKAYLIRKSW